MFNRKLGVNAGAFARSSSSERNSSIAVNNVGGQKCRDAPLVASVSRRSAQIETPSGARGASPARVGGRAKEGVCPSTSASEAGKQAMRINDSITGNAVIDAAWDRLTSSLPSSCGGLRGYTDDRSYRRTDSSSRCVFISGVVVHTRLKTASRISRSGVEPRSNTPLPASLAVLTGHVDR